MNKGGSQEIGGLRVTMTDARHSSGYFDNGQMVYMGEPADTSCGSRTGCRSISLVTPACLATCG
jgi:hypothetical protein